MKTACFRRVLAGLALLLTLGCGFTWAADIQNLSSLEARTLIQENQSDHTFVILDVRTPAEFSQGHIPGARLLDYKSPQFPEGLQRLNKTDTYLIYCRTGNRSGQALRLMKKMGFGKIYHLKAGIMDWMAQKLPLVK